MKQLSLLTLVLVALSVAQANGSKQEYSFHGKEGKPERFFSPKEKSYALADGTKVNFKMEAGKSHTTAYSQLRIAAKCKTDKKPEIKHQLEVCGFTHFEYAQGELTLHLTKYDPGSPKGYCTGGEYTKKLKLCGK